MRNKVGIFLMGWLVAIVFFSVLVAQSKVDEAQGRLEIEGPKGFKVFGCCVGDGVAQEKKFEGSLPTEVSVSYSISKCKVNVPAQKEAGMVTLKFFQNRKLVKTKDFEVPQAGIEIEFPIVGK